MIQHLKKIGVLEIVVFITTVSILAQKGNSEVTYTKDITLDIQDAKLNESIARGKEIYSDFCMQCHLPDGKGTPNVFPPLAGSDWLIKKRKESIHATKYGLNGPIEVNGKPYNSAMTPLGLEDEEIADVMNYIMNSWGNTQKKMVTLEEVSSIKK